MKKTYLWGLASLAFVVAGCSNDEVVNAPTGSAIGFNPFINHSTRALTSDDISGDNLNQFSVYGHTFNTDNVSSLIFDNQLVTKAKSSWTYEPIRYWIVGNTYDFSAFAPANTGSEGTPVYWTYTPGTTASTTGCGSVTYDNEGAQANKDLVYAYQYIGTVTNSMPDVQLNFTHLLSRVRFQFINEFSSPGVYLRITNLVIKDAMASGTLDLSAGLTSASWDTSASGTFAVPAYTFGSSNPTTTSSLFNSAEPNGVYSNHKYLIPTGTEKTYNISFDIEMYASATATTPTATFTGRTVSVSLDMAMNSSYNLVAKINQDNVANEPLNPIVFTATVEAWGAWPTSGTEVDWSDSTSN